MKQKEAVYLANSYIYRTHGPNPSWNGDQYRLDFRGASLSEGIWRLHYAMISINNRWVFDGSVTVYVDDKTGEAFYPN